MLITKRSWVALMTILIGGLSLPYAANAQFGEALAMDLLRTELAEALPEIEEINIRLESEEGESVLVVSFPNADENTVSNTLGIVLARTVESVNTVDVEIDQLRIIALTGDQTGTSVSVQLPIAEAFLADELTQEQFADALTIEQFTPATPTPQPTSTPTATPIPTEATDQVTNYSTPRTRYTTGAANFRSCPRLADACNEGRQLTGGTEVSVTGEITGEEWNESTIWYVVTHQGTEGYIHSVLLTNSPPAPVSNPPSQNLASGSGGRNGVHHSSGAPAVPGASQNLAPICATRRQSVRF